MCKTCQGFGIEYQLINSNIRFRPISMFIYLKFVYSYSNIYYIMKKGLIYLAAGLVSVSAYSQNAANERLQKSGDYGIGIDAVPVVDFVLDKTRIFSNSAPSSAGSIINFYNPFTISGKYMTSDNTAFRGLLSLGYNSETKKNFVPKVGSTSGEKVEDANRSSDLFVYIQAGKQFYRGNRNLRGFYGYDGILGITRENMKSNSYGNDLSVNNSASRVVSSHSGTEISLGARVFVGAEYYLIKNLSLSAELGYGLLYMMNGGGSSTSEKFEGGEVKSETTELAGSSEFTLNTDAMNSKIMLNFYF